MVVACLRWWANALTLGIEMGGYFRRGLLRASGVRGEALDLSSQLGGDRPTALRAVTLLSRELRSLA